MRNAGVATAVAVGVLIFASGAAAQDASGDKKINVQVQLKALYDDNVARSDAATASARGISRDDTIISPSLVADILLPVSRQQLYLRGSIGHDFYQNNDILSSGRYDINGGVNLNIGRCNGSVGLTYREGQSNLADLNVNVTENVEKTTTAAGNLTCGRAAGFAPTVSLEHTTGDNSAPQLHTSDYTSTSGSVGLAYRRPSLGVVTVFYEGNDTEYQERIINIGPRLIKDGYHTDALGISYDRHLGARIGGTVSISYTKLNPDSPFVADFQGMTYTGLVDFRVNSRSMIALNASRQASPATREGAAYNIADHVELTATYGLGSRIALNGGLSWTNNRYKGIVFTPNQLTQQDITAIYGAVNWSIGRRFGLAFDLRHEQSDANAPGLDYSSNQVGVTAIGKF